LKELWGEISSSESLWTWDREDNHSYGLLTLHIDKAHHQTRWPHVFISEEPEVPETLDPSELANIRDLLEKYTSDISNDAYGLGAGMPSLSQGEIDDEIDSNVSRSVVANWITLDGGILGTAKDASPLEVLTTRLPSTRQPRDDRPSIIVKRTVDGLLLSSADQQDSSAPKWDHNSTFSALAFVLASKRDTRFSFHWSDQAVFAFESGGSGNVFIYRPTKKVLDNWAKQSVLKISGGPSGSLLGVGALTADGQNFVLCLCEHELKIIKNII
jgi:hypothetical protein